MFISRHLKKGNMEGKNERKEGLEDASTGRYNDDCFCWPWLQEVNKSTGQIISITTFRYVLVSHKPINIAV
jgi:hypothetical protein